MNSVNIRKISFEDIYNTEDLFLYTSGLYNRWFPSVQNIFHLELVEMFFRFQCKRCGAFKFSYALITEIASLDCILTQRNKVLCTYLRLFDSRFVCFLNCSRFIGRGRHLELGCRWECKWERKRFTHWRIWTFYICLFFRACLISSYPYFILSNVAMSTVLYRFRKYRLMFGYAAGRHRESLLNPESFWILYDHQNLYLIFKTDKEPRTTKTLRLPQFPDSSSPSPTGQNPWMKLKMLKDL